MYYSPYYPYFSSAPTIATGLQQMPLQAGFPTYYPQVSQVFPGEPLMSFTPNLFLNHNPYMPTLYGSSGYAPYSAFGPKTGSAAKQEDSRMQSRVFTWTEEHLQHSKDKQPTIAPFPGLVYQQSPGMPLLQSP
jgi:hypothetical protein